MLRHQVVTTNDLEWVINNTSFVMLFLLFTAVEFGHIVYAISVCMLGVGTGFRFLLNVNKAGRKLIVCFI